MYEISSVLHYTSHLIESEFTTFNDVTLNVLFHHHHLYMSMVVVFTTVYISSH